MGEGEGARERERAGAGEGERESGTELVLARVCVCARITKRATRKIMMQQARGDRMRSLTWASYSSRSLTSCFAASSCMANFARSLCLSSSGPAPRHNTCARACVSTEA